MNEIFKQYVSLKDIVSAHLKGPLTSISLLQMLNDMRKIVDEYMNELTQDVCERLVSQARRFIPPKDIEGIVLSANIVLKAAAINVFIDEYFMSLTSITGLKKKFWDEIEKDGISFSMWSNLQRALRYETCDH